MRWTHVKRGKGRGWRVENDPMPDPLPEEGNICLGCNHLIQGPGSHRGLHCTNPACEEQGQRTGMSPVVANVKAIKAWRKMEFQC